MLTEKEFDERVKLWESERKKYNLQYPSEDVIRFLKKFSDDADKKCVVDYGCGSGRNTKLMKDMGFGRIIAVDANEGCLALTRENLGNVPGIEYVCNKRLELPLDDASVDVLVAWGTLFYFTNADRICNLRILRSKLKNKGVMIADYRGTGDSLYGAGTEIEEDVFLLDEKRGGDLAGIPYWFCNEAQLRNLYEQNGFRILEMQKIDRYMKNLTNLDEHYIVWAEKYEGN